MSLDKEIRIYINSERYEVEASLFSQELGENAVEIEFFETADGDGEPEKMQIKTVGTYSECDGRAEISYDETELTGMEGAKTSVHFDLNSPDVLTMLRTGSVTTALVFEKGKRHHCVYNTPYMTFEVCVHTLDVKNELLQKGNISIDYIVEIRGARAERNKFSMKIMD
ncbi:MAG: DUF1934 domain-containing protein [Ruminococcaceae bacterium]|nr:DUF1934 domain-containing protein [Oscillospiraceae bacterium]